MPERDAGGDELRRALLRQAPGFDLEVLLPSKVSALVQRRRRLRVLVAVGAAAVVVAAVAVPLSALRSEPIGGKITPATTPTPAPNVTSTTVALAPFTCGALDLADTPARTPVAATVTAGPVSATLSGTAAAAPVGGDPWLSDAQLSVTLGAGQHFSEAVVAPTEATMVIPWSIAPSPVNADTTTPAADSGQMCLASFPGESLPTLLLGLDTGYAHCCTVVRAISVSSAGLAPPVDEHIGNPGATLVPDGNFADIATADNAFAYAFASYAESGMPLEVLQFGRGGFIDVTKQHLDSVSKDASVWWTQFNANPGNGLGLLAAWVADQCTLGHSHDAFSTLDRLDAQGKLTGPAGWPVGSAYVQALESFLAQHRYCS